MTPHPLLRAADYGAPFDFNHDRYADLIAEVTDADDEVEAVDALEHQVSTDLMEYLEERMHVLPAPSGFVRIGDYDDCDEPTSFDIHLAFPDGRETDICIYSSAGFIKQRKLSNDELEEAHEAIRADVIAFILSHQPEPKEA